MAIHHTLCLLTTTYRNEPAHIFTECLNILYLINTQTKHPTLHNSHPDKIILESIVRMLQSRTQTTTLHKVKAHANISGNEQADKLAKLGCTLDHRHAVETYEHAHPHHITFKKIGGIQCKIRQIKALFVISENTSLNMKNNAT